MDSGKQRVNGRRQRCAPTDQPGPGGPTDAEPRPGRKEEGHERVKKEGQGHTDPGPQDGNRKGFQQDFEQDGRNAGRDSSQNRKEVTKSQIKFAFSGRKPFGAPRRVRGVSPRGVLSPQAFGHDDEKTADRQRDPHILEGGKPFTQHHEGADDGDDWRAALQGGRADDSNPLNAEHVKEKEQEEEAITLIQRRIRDIIKKSEKRESPDSQETEIYNTDEEDDHTDYEEDDFESEDDDESKCKGTIS